MHYRQHFTIRAEHLFQQGEVTFGQRRRAVAFDVVGEQSEEAVDTGIDFRN